MPEYNMFTRIVPPLQISRASIDAVKDHFREEMTKADWQLMVELKKLFQIIWKHISRLVTLSS